MNQVEFWFIKIPVQNWALVVDHRRQDLLSNLISRAQPRRKNPYASWRSNFRVSNTGYRGGPAIAQFRDRDHFSAVLHSPQPAKRQPVGPCHG
jgi:hypothetical protein